MSAEIKGAGTTLLDEDEIGQLAFPFLLEGGSVNITMTAGHRTLSLVEAPQHPATSGGFASDWIDLYGDAMDDALGIEKTSLCAMAELNSCAVDACERLAGDFTETVCSVLAACMNAQLTWFNLMSAASKALMSVPLPVAVFALASGASTPASAGALEHDSMDLALGDENASPLPGMERSLALPGGSGGPVQANVAEAPELRMDAVIGGTAA